MPKTKEQFDKLKEARKDQLIKCALMVFCDKGYAGTTVDDIVKKAKCSHGLFYHYFKGKKDIYDAVLSSKNQKKSLDLLEKINTESSYKNKLELIINNIYSGLKKDETFAYFFYFFVSQSFKRRDKKLKDDSKCKSTENNPIAFIKNLFLEGQKNGEFITSKTPKECMELFLSIIQGATLIYVIAPKEIRNNMHLPSPEFILDIFCKGVKNEN